MATTINVSVTLPDTLTDSEVLARVSEILALNGETTTGDLAEQVASNEAVILALGQTVEELTQTVAQSVAADGLAEQIAANDLAIKTLAQIVAEQSSGPTFDVPLDRRGGPYTVVADDVGHAVIVDDAVTIENIGILSRIDIINTGAAITPALAGVTLIGETIIETNAAASLIQVSASEWLLVGGGSS